MVRAFGTDQPGVKQSTTTTLFAGVRIRFIARQVGNSRVALNAEYSVVRTEYNGND